ncbi:hypothetical protein GCM10027321_09070 [Massilia terrae]|uniref:Uncharacterized protein n=1 Tax=Massilia terrae TaxID=1811224 RepID=A0ABT2CZW7_9BURK|nr:hypothetical protein [Massilia terrae]MCS0659520.1 hypothetical protein [Massilia terrae]
MKESPNKLGPMLLAPAPGVVQAAPADPPVEPAAQVARDWWREPAPDTAPAVAGAEERPYKS